MKGAHLHHQLYPQFIRYTTRNMMPRPCFCYTHPYPCESYAVLYLNLCTQTIQNQRNATLCTLYTIGNIQHSQDLSTSHCQSLGEHLPQHHIEPLLQFQHLADLGLDRFAGSSSQVIGFLRSSFPLLCYGIHFLILRVLIF